MKFHIAQVNSGRIKEPLESDVMAGFVARLDEINALADGSEGFVWRLQTEAGNATYLRPYDDDRILVNMSVWESVGALKTYVYRTAHAELLRDRNQWFEKFDAAYVALFDNSDEALVNDYEQLLQLLEGGTDSAIATAFSGLIDDFIHRNPETAMPFSSMSEVSEPTRTLTIGPYVLPLSKGHVTALRQAGLPE